MQKVALTNLDLTLYSETLDNGLSIYVVPKENANNIYVTFTTNYGAVQNEFVPYGKDEMIKVPEGVAHFLEHKLFEQEDGVDPFTFFSKNGASSNASTSSYKTTYLFEGTNHFEENLRYLLDFVQAPYFTDENVEKEKGIIIQELKMYQDNPFRMGYEKSLFNTFVEHPIRYSVGGSVESVSSITKEDFVTKVADYATSPNQWKYLGDKPCIVDFYATWCGHCRTLMPILDQLAEEYQDKIYIYKVNVDKERPLSQAFKIKSLPTLFLCPMNGSPRIIQGALPKEQLKTLIDSLLITYD